MSKNTALFAASLLAAMGAVGADYATSEAPAPVSVSHDQSNPCAAGVPTAPMRAGERSYDDIADEFSGAPVAPAPAPARGPAPIDANPCSVGL